MRNKDRNTLDYKEKAHEAQVIFYGYFRQSLLFLGYSWAGSRKTLEVDVLVKGDAERQVEPLRNAQAECDAQFPLC